MQANAQREPASAALDATPQAEGPTAAAAAAAAVVSQTVSDEQPPASAVAEPLPASADAQGAELASAASTPVGAELQPDGTESGATDTSGEPAAAAASMPEANGTLQGVDEAVAVTTAQDQPSADGSSSACQPCGAAAAAEPCAAAPCEATPAALASPMPAEEPDQGGDACQRHAATQTEPPALPIWHQQRRAAAEEAERAAEQAGRTLKRMEELGGEAFLSCHVPDPHRGNACPCHQPSRPTWWPPLPTAADLAIAAAAALTIQRWARGWLARRTAAALREAAAAARQYEVLRRMQLRTPADFLLLFDELAQWWGQEQAKIAAAQGLTGGWGQMGAGGGTERWMLTRLPTPSSCTMRCPRPTGHGFPQTQSGRRRGARCWPRRRACCRPSTGCERRRRRCCAPSVRPASWLRLRRRSAGAWRTGGSSRWPRLPHCRWAEGGQLHAPLQAAA